MALPSAILQRDTRANQPAATAVAAGVVYCVTDEDNILEQSDGSAWQPYSPTGGVAGGPFTDDQLVIGTAVPDELASLGSSGTSVQVLHGSTTGPPSFSSVALGTDVSGDLPFANFVQASGASKLVGRGSASGAGDFQEITPSDGLTMDTTNLKASSNLLTRTVSFSIDGAKTTITTGLKGYISGTPFAGTIVGWYLISKESGSVVIDIWKESAGNIPDVSDSIPNPKPSLSMVQINSSTSLGSWVTTSVAVGDVWGIYVDSVTAITQFTLVLQIAVI